jgi:hypothetical protein
VRNTSGDDTANRQWDGQAALHIKVVQLSPRFVLIMFFASSCICGWHGRFAWSAILRIFTPALTARHRHAASSAAAARVSLHCMVSSRHAPSRNTSSKRRSRVEVGAHVQVLRRCTRVDGRKAYCSALLTSHPPLLPGERFFAPAANSSNAADTPAFPDCNKVRLIHFWRRWL